MPTALNLFSVFLFISVRKHDIHGYEYINDRDMFNSFINSPMVCGLLGSARTYALLTVFSLFFSYIVFL